MPLMGKDLDIGDYDWLSENGVTADQIAGLWTYAEGEAADQSGEYRNLFTGEHVELRRGEPFPIGRFVRANEMPSPRFKEIGEPGDVEGQR